MLTTTQMHRDSPLLFGCLIPSQISDPRTEGGTLTSYTSYHISSTPNPDGVRRRYSDFDWLRDILVARYHGIAVPLMPEKRLVGNQSKSFIEERMQVGFLFCASLGESADFFKRVLLVLQRPTIPRRFLAKQSPLRSHRPCPMVEARSRCGAARSGFLLVPASAGCWGG